MSIWSTDDEPIADATFQHFPPARERLREVERRFDGSAWAPTLPPALQKLGRALEDCCRSRQVQKTVVEVKRNLDVLRDGLEQLGVCQAELTADAIDAVNQAARIREITSWRNSGRLKSWPASKTDANVLTSHLEADRPWREARQLAPALDRIRARYVEVRRALLNQQSVEAEALRSQVKVRPGFAQLDADQAYRVLRPLADAMVETTPEAVSPTLAEVRDRFASRLHPAEEQANDRLDEELSQKPDRQVRKVEAHLRGREVANREQLQAVLKELEERIGPLVDQGIRVRIV